MNAFLKHATTVFVVFSLLFAPISAVAKEGPDVFDDSSAATMAADTVLVRPLGLVSLVAGFGLFVVSSPFSALGGNFGEAWDTMVTKPAQFTFTRPLGEFE